MKKDTIYIDPQKTLSDFTFNESVANVFSDMIHRSLPGYDLIISMINVLAGFYAEQNRNYYDLGCSLGAATISMGRALINKNCRIIAIDNSKAMINRCKNNIDDASINIPVDLICSNLEDVKIENAKIVLLNFTLQFIDHDKRADILTKIYKGLADGGILILSEKITFNEPTEKDFNESLFISFKKANGYSDLEISQKRTALENVLVSDTIELHQERLKECGYSDSKVWYRCLNFASIIAFK